MKNLLLGGSGLVGVNLSRKLIQNGEEVSIIDRQAPQQSLVKKIEFFEADLVSEREKVFEWVNKKFKSTENLSVWHLAANSDIRAGIHDPFVDYKDTLGSTITAIEICKLAAAGFLGFSSSSAVYGDKGGAPVDESVTDLLPISNYGLMKLWSEKLIGEFLRQNIGIQGLIYRFPNVVGLPLTHGIFKDLVHKLREKPQSVEVLGNGKQKKQYIHVEDLVRILIELRQSGISEVLNIAPKDEGVFVKDIAELLRDSISPSSELLFGNTDYGWTGDVPVYYLETRKLQEIGFGNSLNSLEAIKRTVGEIEHALQ